MPAHSKMVSTHLSDRLIVLVPNQELDEQNLAQHSQPDPIRLVPDCSCHIHPILRSLIAYKFGLGNRVK